MPNLLTTFLRHPFYAWCLGAALLSAVPARAQWVGQDTNLPVNSGLTSIDIADANTVWGAGYNGATVTSPYNQYCRTTNGGTTWTTGTLAAGAGLNFTNISGAAGGQTAWAAMYDANNLGGFIWRTTNGGTTWTRQLPNAFVGADGGFINGVKAFNANTAVAVGDPTGATGNWEIYTTTNGTTWATVPTASLPTAQAGEFGNLGTLISVPGTGAATAQAVWFATTQGRVYRSATSGASWGVANTGLANANRLAFSSALHGLAMDASNPGLLKRTLDGGTTWATVIPTGPVYPTGLAGVPGNPGVYVSCGAATGATGSSYTLDGGATWNAIDTGIQHTSVAFLNAATGWSGGFVTTAGLGGIYKGAVTVPTGGYCTTNLGGTNCDITAVQLVGTALNTTASTCTTVGTTVYSSYPASGNTTGTVQAGQSYQLRVTVNDNAILSAWADWNQNQLFEAGEWVQIATSTTAGTPAAVALTVPAGAVPGPTTLRLRSRLSGSVNGATDACSLFGSGETRDYVLTVTAGGGGSGDPAPYCAAPQATGCSGPSITSVALAGTTLSNTSGCAVNASGDAYSNYPATGNTTATVQAGQTYQLTVSSDAAASAIVSVWVDWNRNGVLEATTTEWRQVYITGSGATVALVVPAGAAAGQTRMRIRSRLSGSPNGVGDACTPFGSGEGEDYTLTVTGGSPNSDPAPYCAATQPFGCAGPNIENVSLAGTSLNAASSCSANAVGDAYFNWPATGAGAQTATLQRGQSYQLSVATDASNTAIVSVWVDWNKDNLFGPTEWLQVYTGAQNGSVALLVPASATLGTTRMRVRSRVSGSANGAGDACAQFGSGETEDFTLTIVPGTGNGSDPAPYCAAAHPVGCGSTIITGVALAPTALVSTSTCSATAGGDAYTNYPATGANTATVQRGQALQLVVTTDLSAVVSVWVDWNKDNTFGATEWTRVYATGTAGQVSLTVPATAVVGPTRMRVRSRASGSANAAGDACTSFGSGETEDYTLTVAACTLAVPVVSAPAALCVGSPLALTATNVAPGVSYVWNGPNGFTSTQPAPVIPNPTVAASGAYTLTITSGNCSVTSAPVTVTVRAVPSAAFAYSGATFCLSGANPTPTVTGSGGGVFSSTTGLNLNAATGAINLATSTAGTYTVTYTVAGPCPASSTQTLTLSTAASAAFAYSGATFCLSGANPTPTVTGNGGGVFSSTTGLNLNAATGAINLATSTAGTYTVTYTVAGPCPASSTQTLTLSTGILATLTYAYPNGVCAGAGSPAIYTLAPGATAGTFSAAPAGLVFVAGTPGWVDLSLTQPGTYTITNTVVAAGACPAATATATLLVLPATTLALSGLNAAYCANEPAVVLQGTINGQPATGGFLLDGVSATQFDPATLAPGTHLVTLSTQPGAPGCPGTTSLTVTVNPTPATPTLSAAPQPNGAVLLTSSAATGNQFYFNGVLMVGATSPTLLVTAPGQSGSYTVVATDPPTGCPSAPSAPLNVTLTAVAGQLPGLTVTLAPNPTADGRLTLTLSGPATTQEATLALYDAAGRLVLTQVLPAHTTHHVVDAHALPAGVYAAHLTTAAGILTRRVVRQ